MYNPNRVWKFFKSFTVEKTFTANFAAVSASDRNAIGLPHLPLSYKATVT